MCVPECVAGCVAILNKAECVAVVQGSCSRAAGIIQALLRLTLVATLVCARACASWRCTVNPAAISSRVSRFARCCVIMPMGTGQ